MSTLVKNDQTLSVGANRSVLVGNDETNLVKNDRQLTVDANDSVVIGGTHDKTITGAVTQLYGNDHSRKVDGNQEFFEEQNKDEHVKLAHKLTTDKKFQLIQGATSMTFKNTNVTVDSAGVITLMAGGATVCLDKTGKATFDSPTGINFVCGASTLSVLPGGVVLASPAVTAAAGAGSTMAMGKEAVAMKSKTVVIEADGVCSIKGKSKLGLQEAKGPAGKKVKGEGKGPKESPAAAHFEKTLREGDSWIIVKTLDSAGTPIVNHAFKLTTPSGTAVEGNTPKDATVTVRGISDGKCRFEWIEDADHQSNGLAADGADKPKKTKLWVRIDISPAQAGKDKFILTSSDGSFTASKTAADDKVPNDESIDLLFDEVDSSLKYTLKVTSEDGSSTTVFENVAYSKLAALRGAMNGPSGADEAQDLGEHTGEIEQVSAGRGRDL